MEASDAEPAAPRALDTLASNFITDKVWIDAFRQKWVELGMVLHTSGYCGEPEDLGLASSVKIFLRVYRDSVLCLPWPSRFLPCSSVPAQLWFPPSMEVGFLCVQPLMSIGH